MVFLISKQMKNINAKRNKLSKNGVKRKKTKRNKKMKKKVLK